MYTCNHLQPPSHPMCLPCRERSRLTVHDRSIGYGFVRSRGVVRAGAAGRTAPPRSGRALARMGAVIRLAGSEPATETRAST